MNKIIITALLISLTLTGCTGQGNKQNAAPKPKDQTKPQARVAQLKTSTLHPGNVHLTDTSHPKRSITTIGYLEPVDPGQAIQEVKKDAEHLSYMAFFSYQVQPDGSLIGIKDNEALAATKKTDATPMMVITNFTGGNFSPDVAHRIFTDKTVSKNLMNNILQTMKSKGYKALNIDFEHIQAKDRQLYNGFLETIIPIVRNAGFPVSTALAPKTSDELTGSWHGAHDYKRHGELADFVVLMTYEWGWSGGPPMAVAPIPQVKQVLDYATKVIPREKIVMGAPLYGYDWTLPYKQGGPWAKRIAPKDAANLAIREQATVKFDNTALAPNFTYTDDNGKKHVVWYENEQSIQAKFNLVNQYHLRGMAYWELGEPFPQNWTLLRDNFYIRKAGVK